MNSRNYLKPVLLLMLAIFFLSCSDEDNTLPPSPHSPYIAKVFDFCPAIGQFTNNLPKYEKGDTKSDILSKVSRAIVGEKTSMISLGGFGGYVVFGFDHTIENKVGLCDFRIKGNAFKAENNPNPEVNGGSCEPGIILVSYDANKNGVPDDEWYEIAGSEHNNPKTIKNYEITYYKPDINKKPIAGDAEWQIDVEYIKWEDNQGKTGYKIKNSYHDQSYFPEWITEDKITFKGTKLSDNAVNEGVDGGDYWVLYSYSWGYADNYPNDEDKSAIDIDWAVDKNGNKANLDGIDFVKVYTGINQEAGWLGEVSTEISGAEDLHLLNKKISTFNK